MNVNPLYLTGERESPANAPKPSSANCAPEESPEEEEAPVEEPAPPPEPNAQLPPGSDALTAEDLQNLIFALYVQSKAGIATAKEKLDKIKQIILS